MKTISGKEVDVRKMVWQNTNKLLGEEGFIGGKTGQTQFAGNCLASVYENKNNQRFIVIILGCSTKELRFKETRWLVEKYINKTI
jgi:D-alanyl-D-alanine carboxypeptidase